MRRLGWLAGCVVFGFVTRRTRLLVALVLVVLVSGCAPESGVFSWGEDDIGEWVSEAEVRAVLDDLSMRYTGAPLDGEVVFEADDGSGSQTVWRSPSVWSVGAPYGANYWAVHVHDGSHDWQFGDPPLVLQESAPGVLPEGVVWGAGWGKYRFRGPNSDETICLGLQVPGSSLRQPSDWDEMVLEIASMMLRELGWAD